MHKELEESGTENPTQTVPHPHDKLWFHDGNIIVSTDTLLFKVHKGILSLQSSIFRDMFDLSGIETTCETELSEGRRITEDMYEGLPLVKLVDDRGEDIAHLLMTVYCRHYYRLDRDDNELEVAISLLLLSMKYDFKTITIDVVRHISRIYPLCYNKFFSLEDANAQTFSSKTRSECHFPLLMAASVHNIEVLLAPLYYSCATLPIRDIFKFALEIGLDQDRLQKILRGREIVLSAVTKVIVRFSEHVHNSAETSCSHPNDYCLQEAGLLGLENLIITPSIKVPSATDLLKCISGEFCNSCEKQILTHIEKERRRFWGSIPSAFGFPEWATLEKMMETEYSFVEA